MKLHGYRKLAFENQTICGQWFDGCVVHHIKSPYVLTNLFILDTNSPVNLLIL